MYKVIMCLATIDSVATTQTLHDNLQLLGVFAATVSGDIDKLHNEFNKTCSQLIAGGATVKTPLASFLTPTSGSPVTILSHLFAASTRTTRMANLPPSPTRH
jgi:hypothetical protein